MSKNQKNQREEDEDIEGLDGAEDGAWGDYPIDTMLIRNENRTVHDVLRRIKGGCTMGAGSDQRK